MKNLWISLKITLAMCIVLGVGYVLVLRGISAVAGPNGGEADVVTLDGQVVGAANVGQRFTDVRYFWSRPSAVDYNGGGSGGSNKATTNPEHLAGVEQRVQDFLAAHPYLSRAEVPAEMVTASGSYVWRGVRESGPAFQPSLTMSAGNFSATAWGSVDFDSAYKEMDLTLAYALGPVTLSVADLYWTGHADDRYFVFDSRSPHRIEVGASWVVSEKVPVTLSWYTVLFGAADVNHKGERAYASYFEAACPFTVKTVDMKAGVGMVPWNAAATYLTGDRGFCVQNVFLNAGKSWTIKGTDSMSVGVFTNLIWNPALDDVNFVGGISFRM